VVDEQDGAHPPSISVEAGGLHPGVVPASRPV
jgi:hypothetical protein